MKRWLCIFGLHDWEQSRPVGLQDGFPFPGQPYKNPTRRCLRCDKKQHWLPGYGGSEWGCWSPGPSAYEETLDGG